MSNMNDYLRAYEEQSKNPSSAALMATRGTVAGRGINKQERIASTQTELFQKGSKGGLAQVGDAMKESFDTEGLKTQIEKTAGAVSGGGSYTSMAAGTVATGVKAVYVPLESAFMGAMTGLQLAITGTSGQERGGTERNLHSSSLQKAMTSVGNIADVGVQVAGGIAGAALGTVDDVERHFIDSNKELSKDLITSSEAILGEALLDVGIAKYGVQKVANVGQAAKLGAKGLAYSAKAAKEGLSKAGQSVASKAKGGASKSWLGQVKKHVKEKSGGTYGGWADATYDLFGIIGRKKGVKDTKRFASQESTAFMRKKFDDMGASLAKETDPKKIQKLEMNQAVAGMNIEKTIRKNVNHFLPKVSMREMKKAAYSHGEGFAQSISSKVDGMSVEKFLKQKPVLTVQNMVKFAGQSMESYVKLISKNGKINGKALAETLPNLAQEAITGNYAMAKSNLKKAYLANPIKAHKSLSHIADNLTMDDITKSFFSIGNSKGQGVFGEAVQRASDIMKTPVGDIGNFDALQSLKLAPNMVQEGVTAMASGAKDKAASYFQKALKAFPETDAGKKARQSMAEGDMVVDKKETAKDISQRAGEEVDRALVSEKKSGASRQKTASSLLGKAKKMPGIFAGKAGSRIAQIGAAGIKLAKSDETRMFFEGLREVGKNTLQKSQGVVNRAIAKIPLEETRIAAAGATAKTMESITKDSLASGTRAIEAPLKLLDEKIKLLEAAPSVDGVASPKPNPEKKIEAIKKFSQKNMGDIVADDMILHSKKYIKEFTDRTDIEDGLKKEILESITPALREQIGQVRDMVNMKHGERPVSDMFEEHVFRHLEAEEVRLKTIGERKAVETTGQTTTKEGVTIKNPKLAEQAKKARSVRDLPPALMLERLEKAGLKLDPNKKLAPQIDAAAKKIGGPIGEARKKVAEAYGVGRPVRTAKDNPLVSKSQLRASAELKSKAGKHYGEAIKEYEKKGEKVKQGALTKKLWNDSIKKAKISINKEASAKKFKEEFGENAAEAVEKKAEKMAYGGANIRKTLKSDEFKAAVKKESSKKEVAFLKTRNRSLTALQKKNLYLSSHKTILGKFLTKDFKKFAFRFRSSAVKGGNLDLNKAYDDLGATRTRDQFADAEDKRKGYSGNSSKKYSNPFTDY